MKVEKKWNDLPIDHFKLCEYCDGSIFLNERFWLNFKNELQQFHAVYTNGIVLFDSEAHYLWFLLKWQ